MPKADYFGDARSDLLTTPGTAPVPACVCNRLRLCGRRVATFGFDLEPFHLLGEVFGQSLQFGGNSHNCTGAFGSLMGPFDLGCGDFPDFLGTFGLATVQLRSVLERRAELALLRAAGFRRGRLARLVLCENAVLLMGGLILGIASALITVLPHMMMGGAALPVGMLVIMLGVVPVVGLLSGLLAVNAPIRQRNSLTKPFRPGKPTEERTKKTMKNAQTGMRLDRPLSWFMSRVW